MKAYQSGEKTNQKLKLVSTQVFIIFYSPTTVILLASVYHKSNHVVTLRLRTINNFNDFSFWGAFLSKSNYWKPRNRILKSVLIDFGKGICVNRFVLHFSDKTEINPSSNWDYWRLNANDINITELSGRQNNVEWFTSACLILINKRHSSVSRFLLDIKSSGFRD